MPRERIKTSPLPQKFHIKMLPTIRLRCHLPPTLRRCMNMESHPQILRGSSTASSHYSVEENGRGVAAEAITLEEWQGWGTSSPIPAMVLDVIDDLKLLERDIDVEMSFGGIGGKLQGDFRVQEDKKHRATYHALNNSEKKLQFFSARQIACRLLGSRGYLCQTDFLRQNNTGKLLWQVFGTQAATLCLYGIHEHEEIMWNAFKLADRVIKRYDLLGYGVSQKRDFQKVLGCKSKVWILYPNKNAPAKSVQDICFLGSPLSSERHSQMMCDDAPLNFVLIDGTWNNSAAMFRRLKEHAKSLWGEEDLPCISLSTSGVSVMHKLRPQPSWDRTCTAAAAFSLLLELSTQPEVNIHGLDKQAEAVENALDLLLEALTSRRLRMGRSITRRGRHNHIQREQN